MNKGYKKYLSFYLGLNRAYNNYLKLNIVILNAKAITKGRSTLKRTLLTLLKLSKKLLA